MRYISDEIDISKIQKGKLNLIASGTGSGKSTFIINDLLNHYPDIEAKDVIFVTSRAMIVEQQVKSEKVSQLHKYNTKLISYWNGEIDSDKINKSDISIMTYDILINIIKNNDFTDRDALDNVKMIILDECHTMFSDDFIKDIEMLKLWTSIMIKKNNKIIIGLTATPHIIHYAVEHNTWGVEINQLNDSIIINYHAKNLICTDFNTIPYLIASNALKGKTLIMCYTVEDCYTLKNKIFNSTVLVSKNNNLFNDDMKQLRDYIIENANLPDTYTETTVTKYKNKDGIVEEEKTFNTYPLKVLLTTSTLREGVNIQTASNVKNVISCFTDDLHIIQFAGRCRHDLENLVIAETYIRSDNRNGNSYLTMRRKQFKEFLYSNNCTESEWYDTIKHITDVPIFKVYKVKFDKNTMKFIDYMNEKWLVPIGTDNSEIGKYYIYKPEDKEEILNKALYYGILKHQTRQERVVFNTVMDYLKYSLGYKVEDGKKNIDKKQMRYKLIVEYDKGNGNFHYLDCSESNEESEDE